MQLPMKRTNIPYGVEIPNNVLSVRILRRNNAKNVEECLMMMTCNEVKMSQDVERDTLMCFHQRIEHPSYRLYSAKSPSSYNVLNDMTR